MFVCLRSCLKGFEAWHATGHPGKERMWEIVRESIRCMKMTRVKFVIENDFTLRYPKTILERRREGKRERERESPFLPPEVYVDFLSMKLFHRQAEGLQERDESY